MSTALAGFGRKMPRMTKSRVTRIRHSEWSSDQVLRVPKKRFCKRLPKRDPLFVREEHGSCPPAKRDNQEMEKPLSDIWVSPEFFVAKPATHRDGTGAGITEEASSTSGSSASWPGQEPGLVSPS